MTPGVRGADLAVRRRQILLAGGLLAGVLAIALVGALLYEYRQPAGLLPAGQSATHGARRRRPAGASIRATPGAASRAPRSRRSGASSRR